jgi:hypothetical protein
MHVSYTKSTKSISLHTGTQIYDSLHCTTKLIALKSDGSGSVRL